MPMASVGVRDRSLLLWHDVAFLAHRQVPACGPAAVALVLSEAIRSPPETQPNKDGSLSVRSPTNAQAVDGAVAVPAQCGAVCGCACLVMRVLPDNGHASEAKHFLPSNLRSWAVWLGFVLCTLDFQPSSFS